MSFITENLFTILIGGMIILLYFLMKRRSTFFSSRGLPYVVPSWTDLIKSFVSIEHFFLMPAQLYKQKKNEDTQFIGYFQAFYSPVILVLDPAMAESVIIKDFSHFVDHGFDFDSKTNPLLGHLFNMNGDEWRTLRHKLLPTFTSGKLKGMTPLMEECADSLISEMKENKNLRHDAKLKELFRKYTLATIAVCAFGIDPQGIKDPDSEFIKNVEKVITPTIMSQVKFAIALNFPRFMRLWKMKLVPSDVEAFFLRLTKDTLELRKKSGIKRNDFMQLLLELREKGSVDVDVKELEDDDQKLLNGGATLHSETPATKLELTDGLLSAQAFVFLVAGFDNTAYLTSITCYILSKYPEIQRRIRNEVREAKSKHGHFSYAALKEMPLIGATMDETLRLYSPIQALPRVCTKTYTCANGCKIEKGTSLMIPVSGIHYDSKYWPNPEEFDPDRFLNGSYIKPAAYLPFGDGPRLCIAQRLALLMSKMMIAKIVDNFEILHSSKNKEPIQLSFFGSIDAKGGLWASFKPLET